MISADDSMNDWLPTTESMSSPGLYIHGAFSDRRRDHSCVRKVIHIQITYNSNSTPGFSFSGFAGQETGVLQGVEFYMGFVQRLHNQLGVRVLCAAVCGISSYLQVSTQTVPHILSYRSSFTAQNIRCSRSSRFTAPIEDRFYVVQSRKEMGGAGTR